MPPSPPDARARAQRRPPTLRERFARAFHVGLPACVVGALAVHVGLELRARRAELAEQVARAAEELSVWSAGLAPDEELDAEWLARRLETPHTGSPVIGGAAGDGVAGVRLLSRSGELSEWWRDGSSPGFLAPRAERSFVRGDRVAGTLSVAADAGPLHRLLLRALLHVLVLGGGSYLVASRLAQRAHSRLSGEILGLVHAVNAVSTRKDYSIRVVRRTEDEVGVLVDTLNHMIELVEQRDRQLQSEVERAEAASRAKAKFLATMSHEIRTPINGILGNTELLLHSSLDEEQADYGRSIYGSAEGLLHVINDILDYSKLQAGQMRFERTNLSVSEVVHECLSTVGALASEKGIELCCRIDHDVPAALLGDPMRLRQVLLNLVSNALKFTEEGEVAVGVAVEARGSEDCRLLFTVRDSGIGIPADRLDRLFGSFSQVDASHSRKYGGSGLGLAISKQIVEGLGGEIFVETEEGVGSTFGFRLDLGVAEERADEHDACPTGLRVLVADANETNRGDVAYALRRGNDVVVAGDAAEAWACLRRAVEEGEPFDALVLDARLAPELVPDGEEDPEPFVASPLVLLVPVGRLRTASVPGWRGRTASLGRPARREGLGWCLAELLSDEDRVRRSPRPGERGALPRLAAGTEGVRVLVAEDHPVNQRITSRFLERIGCSFELVEDGEEAVRAWETGEFDVVLMDVQMPRMDGLEATREIRRRCAATGRHVWIVALTANALDEQARECFQAGCDDYVCKPFKLGVLRERIERWVREPRPAPEGETQEKETVSRLMGDGGRPPLRLANEPRITR